ncbi:pseudaminic acid cytidylyltransferase [Saccharobesus litoralis]|uniref:Pseudaminic acid cytidylyltransferase n=1 Tax=Saccharobesus litoralis TaxID=2172099 RepID=A0A2S0VU90_9ALTE|nr:pseudaminic acid cytidylyltransferase [Saccharobesus litoralis]AWB67794.1 pseudaminic acid cytidylyltransferase [Saccharobesus litoralis]
MRSLAIIPARGGSKRIPKKNIRSFAGKPLIAYSIEAATASNCFDKVIVSTDCPQIAQVARDYGADVPFTRPDDLSGDFVGTMAVTRHAIVAMQALGQSYEFCCCIYATAPFLQPNYLQQGMTALQQNKSKAFAFSATSFAFPIQRSFLITEQGAEVMFPNDIGKRSQDLPEAFHDAGQFYWGRTQDYIKGGKGMFTHHSIPIVLPRHLVQDIDTMEDWQRAELMYQAYIKNENNG